jgi:hypothetical protein
MERQNIMVRNVGWSRAAPLMADRRQRENACASQLPPFSLHQDTQPVEWCHPHSEQVFLK